MKQCLGVKQWQAICAIASTTQYFMSHTARHCFTPNAVSSHLPSFVQTLWHWTGFTHGPGYKGEMARTVTCSESQLFVWKHASIFARFWTTCRLIEKCTNSNREKNGTVVDEPQLLYMSLRTFSICAFPMNRAKNRVSMRSGGIWCKYCSSSSKRPNLRKAMQGSINVLCKTRWGWGVSQSFTLHIEKGAWPIKNLTMGVGGQAHLISASYVICLCSLHVVID